MVFTDRAEWEAAVSSFSVETFDSFNGTDIKSQGLDVGDFTVTQFGQPFGSTAGTINSSIAGVTSPGITGQVGSGISVNLMYDSSIYAWGGDLRPGSQSFAIQILGTNYIIDPAFEFGFFGILDDTNSFTEVDIVRRQFTNTFALDNVSYSSDMSSNPTSTPEPSLILSLLGLGGLVAANKKKQK